VPLTIERFVRLARKRGGSSRQLAGLRQAGVRVDGQILEHASEPDGAPLRLALLELELAAAAGVPAAVDAAAARLAATSASTRFAATGPGVPEEAPTPSRLRPAPTTRIALQSAVALSLAFLISQSLFPDRWSWTIVSVLAISGGLRSRGDALVLSTERLLGALAGTAVATVLASAIGEQKAVAIVAILALLLVGTVLRDRWYAAWAFCVTSVLALLYGLYGERGNHLLAERLAQNAIGALCVIVPSYFLLPIPTAAVVRRRLAATLAALAETLERLAAGAAPAELVAATRAADRSRELLASAVRPARIHGHALGSFGRPGPVSARSATETYALHDAVRVLVGAALTAGASPPPAAIDELRRDVGARRRSLAETSRAAAR
jgi:uncharacterized membrane protein YccC